MWPTTQIPTFRELRSLADMVRVISEGYRAILMTSSKTTLCPKTGLTTRRPVTNTWRSGQVLWKLGQIRRTRCDSRRNYASPRSSCGTRWGRLLIPKLQSFDIDQPHAITLFLLPLPYRESIHQMISEYALARWTAAQTSFIYILQQQPCLKLPSNRQRSAIAFKFV